MPKRGFRTPCWTRSTSSSLTPHEIFRFGRVIEGGSRIVLGVLKANIFFHESTATIHRLLYIFVFNLYSPVCIEDGNILDRDLIYPVKIPSKNK